MYKAVKITRGSSGWGGPLIVQADAKRNKILSVTGGGIHPIAAKLAEMTGGVAVDGFKGGAPDDEILIAVVDCGGTARCGVYPKKKIFTVNLMPVGKSGPLAQFITEDIYVSDVKEENISFADASEAAAPVSAPAAAPAADSAPKTKDQAKAEIAAMREQKEPGIITKIGIGVGKVVGKFFQAGRESIDMVIRNILPFMAFTATILGIISASGLGDVIANTIAPLCSTLPGMLVISIVCALPFPSCPRFWAPARLSRRLSARCSVRRSAWATSRRSMRCLRCLRSTRRLAATSFRSVCPSARLRRTPSSLAFRLSSIPASSPARCLSSLHSY